MVLIRTLRDGLKRWQDQQYTLIVEPPAEKRGDNARLGLHHHVKSICVYVAALIGVLSLLAVISQALPWSWPSEAPYTPCTDPPIRREWRSLTTEEKADFTQAVNCLGTVPSRWGRNGTLYDDFAFLHGSIGSWCHRSASFLPWHRYTLSAWETALKDYCGYWNWSLDWRGLANSSVWDSSTGFGGDGDPDSAETVGEGRCVTDGPFTQLRPIMYNHTFVQHCLSRGFRDGDSVGSLPGTLFSPEKIGRIVRKPTYKEFVRDVELHLHNPLHNAIGGDFMALTAANDPIFFLHHAQLDHLWWQWQQENASKRLREYHGMHMYNSTDEDASLDAILLYGGFIEDIPVSKIMNTENGFLCYRY